MPHFLVSGGEDCSDPSGGPRCRQAPPPLRPPPLLQPRIVPLLPVLLLAVIGPVVRPVLHEDLLAFCDRPRQDKPHPDRRVVRFFFTVVARVVVRGAQDGKEDGVRFQIGTLPVRSVRGGKVAVLEEFSHFLIIEACVVGAHERMLLRMEHHQVRTLRRNQPPISPVRAHNNAFHAIVPLLILDSSQLCLAYFRLESGGRSFR